MAKARFCNSPDCTRKTPFTPISDAAVYCCVRCKNRANYIFTNLEYEFEVLRHKERKRNIKILEYLLSVGQWRVSYELLLQMGFTFEVTYIPFVDGNHNKNMRFGNCYLKMVDQDNFEITYINN